MLCGLGEEECTKFRKQKIKKEKKLNAAKSVGRDERVSHDIQPCEIFFAALKPFLNQTAFTPNFWSSFWVLNLKLQLTRLIALKFGTYK